jgi:chromosome transmission fidelity protein 1
VILTIQIITLPYPLILQDSAREALGVSLDDHIVIIDEAHNLMDSICGIYSCEITLSQLQQGREQLILYLQRFRNKLKGKNRIYVTQIIRLLDSLIAYLQPKSVSKGSKDGEVQISELLSSKGVDQINLFKLNTYIHESRLARKVDGYTAHKASNDKVGEQDSSDKSTTPVLMQIQSFMLALMNPSSEGRFFFSIDGSDVSLSYLLLDAAPHFQTIVSSARAVILAGGTMSPMDDYITHLFPYVDKDRIMTLSCSHIVPASSLVVYPVSQGPSGEEFEFTFEKRGRRDLIVAAGKTLLQIVSVVPDGVVAFFPSYNYLETCLDIWNSTILPATNFTLLEALRSKKPLFCEQKTSSLTNPLSTSSSTINSNSNYSSNSKSNSNSNSKSAAESLLTSYTNAIQHPNTPSRGALLLAVLSGSLSEGINFSDSLGRCVVVFGLPFPNPQSATWKAKRAYISQRASSAAREAGKSVADAEHVGKQAAAEFYLNSTMRAVNQAVGRAIRHKGDYAAIVLVDKRYDGERIKSKLPGWMKESIVGGRGVKQIVNGLTEFFGQKQSRQ